jgi:hypothetical protein
MTKIRSTIFLTLLMLSAISACTTGRQIAATATPRMEIREPTMSSPPVESEIPVASPERGESTPDLIDTPLHPVSTEAYQTNEDVLEEDDGEWINFVSVQGDLLLVGNFSGTLTLMDLTDPTQPKALVNLDLGMELDSQEVRSGVVIKDFKRGLYIRKAILEGNLLYLLSVTRLWIIDLEDPLRPNLLSEITFNRWLADFEIQDGFLWVLHANELDQNTYLHVIDASNPRKPDVVKESTFPGVQLGRIGLEQGIAFHTSGHFFEPGNMRIFDVEDPNDPRLRYEISGIPAHKGWVEARRAFISTGRIDFEVKWPALVSSSIALVNLSDPRGPMAEGFIYTPYLVSELAVSGDIVFLSGVADSDHDRYIWIEAADIQNPLEPRLLYTMRVEGYGPTDIAVGMGYTYLAVDPIPGAGTSDLYILRPEVGYRVAELTTSDLLADETIQFHP